jgi:probable selenium-dependent hydroxylase accessory protein YqeC
VILRALGIQRGDIVAVAGAGGKTTLAYRLAREARSCGLTVLVTTTTHMGTLDEAVTGPVIVESDGDPAPALQAALAREGWATLLGRRVRPDKLEGITASRVDALAGVADVIVVEADGARGRSLKLPASHEPVIPSSATVVVIVCGLDALGQPLDDDHVHRIEIVRAATGVEPGEAVDEDCLASALRHADGYPSRIPPRARVGVFFNKAESDDCLAAGARLAARLIPPYHWVAAGSAQAGTVRTWPPMRSAVR